MRLLVLSLALLIAPGAAAAAAPRAAPTPIAPVLVPNAQRATQAEALAFVRAFSPSDLRRRAEIEVVRKSYVPGLRNDPNTAQVLDTFPELGSALSEALISQVDVYIEEFDERFFPRAAAIVQQYIPREDVRKLTAFYTSPTGRRALEAAVANVDGSEIMKLAIRGEDLSTAVANRQALRLGMTTFGALSDADRKAVLDIMQSPAGRRLATIRPKLVALQVELTNNPGPRFQAGAQKALADAFERVTGVRPPESK